MTKLFWSTSFPVSFRLARAGTLAAIALTMLASVTVSRAQAPASRRVTPVVPPDRFAVSALPVTYFAQNWTPAESVEFHHLRQGSPLMRKELFDALEQPDATDLFRDTEYFASFGFLPQRRHALNPDGYPIGFSGTTAIEIACAACHTSRIRHGGKEYRMDGSQAMIDLDRWMAELIRALVLTLADGPTAEELEELGPSVRFPLDPTTKFGRFAARVLGTNNPRASQVDVLMRSLQADLTRRQRYSDYNAFGRRMASDAERQAAQGHLAYGHGRIDALGAILNQACAEALKLDANAAMADAPVNFPAIWDAPQHTHVQWNGAVDNTARFGPLGRNAGQVIGVFGLLDVQGDALIGYDSSVHFDALNRAEELITKLWSPLWPFDKDDSLVPAGKAVYRSACVQCHALMKRDDPRRTARDQLIPINQPWGSFPALNTDPLTAKNWRDRMATLGVLAGRNRTVPLGGRFPRDANARVPSREVLTHQVFNVIARSFVPWREELTLDTPGSRVAFAAPDEDELMRYKSRPLNGVWSTAPYLHNGSVRNMVELLTPPDRRQKTFHVGTTDYDAATLGFVDSGPFLFDTNLPGNRNTGHEYGTELPDKDKKALLEFLKTL